MFDVCLQGTVIEFFTKKCSEYSNQSSEFLILYFMRLDGADVCFLLVLLYGIMHNRCFLREFFVNMIFEKNLFSETFVNLKNAFSYLHIYIQLFLFYEILANLFCYFLDNYSLSKITMVHMVFSNVTVKLKLKYNFIQDQICFVLYST